MRSSKCHTRVPIAIPKNGLKVLCGNTGTSIIMSVLPQDVPSWEGLRGCCVAIAHCFPAINPTTFNRHYTRVLQKPHISRGVQATDVNYS